MKKVLVVFGTRPEAIKMAPLVKGLQKREDDVDVKVCVTAQHREMLDQVLEIFEISPDYDLDIMKKNQDLFDINATILLKMRSVLQDYQPDGVFVHGDTSTTFATALAGFFNGTKIYHVEAGLRTNNILSPFPEEANRKLTAVVTNTHFVPTEKAKENLIKEGYSTDNIIITGNTVIDALHLVMRRLENEPELLSEVEKEVSSAGFQLDENRPVVLITGHRRENFGQGMIDICDALAKIAKAHPKADLVYPVHLNPKVKDVVNERLADYDNIHLIKPLDYTSFIYLLNKSYIVLTDSGGIQEEAPSLGKPVLVMREVTERPEAVIAGTVKLVGTDVDKIYNNVSALLSEEEKYIEMSKATNPYGDGLASERIIKHLLG